MALPDYYRTHMRINKSGLGTDANVPGKIGVAKEEKIYNPCMKDILYIKNWGLKIRFRSIQICD